VILPAVANTAIEIIFAKHSPATIISKKRFFLQCQTIYRGLLLSYNRFVDVEVLWGAGKESSGPLSTESLPNKPLTCSLRILTFCRGVAFHVIVCFRSIAYALWESRL